MDITLVSSSFGLLTMVKVGRRLIIKKLNKPTSTMHCLADTIIERNDDFDDFGLQGFDSSSIFTRYSSRIYNLASITKIISFWFLDGHFEMVLRDSFIFNETPFCFFYSSHETFGKTKLKVTKNRPSNSLRSRENLYYEIHCL